MAQGVTETLCSDAMLQLLCEAKVAQNKELLMKFCEGVLKEWSTDSAQVDELKGAASAEPLVLCLGSFQKFARAAIHLLHDDPTGAVVQTSPKDLEYFIHYSGTGLFERTVKNILTTEEAAGASQPAMENRNYLRQRVSEVVRTAASTLKLAPEFAMAKSKMEPETPSIADLAFVCDKVPAFRAGMRAQECEPLEKLAIVRLVAFAARVRQGSVPFSSKELQSLCRMLRVFGSNAAAMEAQNRLCEWGTQHNKKLCQQDVVQWLKDYIEQRQNPSMQQATPPRELLPLLKKMSATDRNAAYPSEMRNLMTLGTFYLLEHAIKEAKRNQCSPNLSLQSCYIPGATARAASVPETSNPRAPSLKPGILNFLKLKPTNKNTSDSKTLFLRWLLSYFGNLVAGQRPLAGDHYSRHGDGRCGHDFGEARQAQLRGHCGDVARLSRSRRGHKTCRDTA